MDEQTRAIALQLAWHVHELAKHGGIAPETLAAAKRVIDRGGYAPSNSTTLALLNEVLDAWPEPARV